MKTALTLAATLLLTSTASFAKIVHTKNKLFFESKGSRIPIESVNGMIKEKKISKIKLYGDGKVNLISFSKNGGTEKLYSVDEKGFVYSLDPFTNYRVKEVHSDGKISFQEAPGKKYKISPQGFFLH